MHTEDALWHVVQQLRALLMCTGADNNCPRPPPFGSGQAVVLQELSPHAARSYTVAANPRRPTTPCITRCPTKLSARLTSSRIPQLHSNGSRPHEPNPAGRQHEDCSLHSAALDPHIRRPLRAPPPSRPHPCHPMHHSHQVPCCFPVRQAGNAVLATFAAQPPLSLL